MGNSDIDTFRPGLYRHYRGGLYTALCLVTHHETRKPMVLYVSHNYGAANVRPLRGWGNGRDTECSDMDGWLDMVRLPEEAPLRGSRTVPRFEYIGSLPSDTKITERKPDENEEVTITAPRHVLKEMAAMAVKTSGAHLRTSPSFAERLSRVTMADFEKILEEHINRYGKRVDAKKADDRMPFNLEECQGYLDLWIDARRRYQVLGNFRHNMKMFLGAFTDEQLNEINDALEERDLGDT